MRCVDQSGFIRQLIMYPNLKNNHKKFLNYEFVSTLQISYFLPIAMLRSLQDDSLKNLFDTFPM